MDARYNMKRLSYIELKDYKRSMNEIPQKYFDAVSEIIRNVREKGDIALIDYASKFDGTDASSYSISATGEEIELAVKETREKYAGIFSYFMNAAANIREFHKKERDAGFSYIKNGSLYGQKVSPIDRAGLYVPGGRAFYPSTVLMNVIPAKIAGVPEIFIATPPGRDGRIKNALAVALAAELGVTGIFKTGGAQAIAALAYGTQTIPSVSKIVGPGNIYVAAAKLLVSGHVGIDSIAGPTEVVIFADETANPKWAAIDMCAQAEHTGDNTVILISDSEKFINEAERALDKILPSLKRRDMIEKSLESRAFAVAVQNYKEGFEIINRIAPEHVEVMIRMDAKEIISNIRNAGALFIGNWTPVSSGDYYAGPNHVIPTNGTAVFSSPLGVYDFVKRTSYLSLTREYIMANGKEISSMAQFEELDAHAASINTRIESE